MSRRSLATNPKGSPSRAASSRFSTLSSTSAQERAPGTPIDLLRERALIDACTHGDALATAAALGLLLSNMPVLTRDAEELLGYAFSCAAGANHPHILELLLESSGPAVRETLLHGICREPRYFPPRSFFHCCFSLRYLAFAAVVSVEQRALTSLQWLTAKRLAVCNEEDDCCGDGDIDLLMDAEVVRCFRLACTLAIRSFASPAAPGSISEPEQYRPLMTLLVGLYPKRLLPLVHSAAPVDSLVYSTSICNEHLQAQEREAGEALRATLLFEFMANTSQNNKTQH